jgi:tetratricopeptide (TPR) repeat protein
VAFPSEAARRVYEEGSDRTQPERALPLFEKAISLGPNFIMAYDALVRVSPTFKDAGEALRKVEELAARVPRSDGERLYFDALFAARRGDRTGQLKKLEQLAELYPRDERVLYQLGLFHYGTDDEAAVRVFRRALAVNPGFVPVYNRMGYSLPALGRNAEAEEMFKRAIELDPDSPNVYDSYAELLLKLGRFDESIANYDEALAREPLFPSAQIGLAANLILQGKHATARKRLRSLLRHRAS